MDEIINDSDSDNFDSKARLCKSLSHFPKKDDQDSQ